MTESLLEETNYLNPTPWKSQLKLCVCPDAHDAVNSQSIPLCSANEEKTCTKTKSHKGKKMHNGTRPKRETRGNVNLDIAKRVRRLKRSIVERHEIHRKRVRMSEYQWHIQCINMFKRHCHILTIFQF